MLSILIVNWNTRELLKRCLESIRRFPPPGPYEVIVVDNASSDGSSQMVAADHPWVRLIASKTNTGYAEGNNLAFSEAEGDLLLTLNPDTEIREDTFKVSSEAVKDSDVYGVGTVKLIGTDGKPQHSVRGFPSLLGIIGATTGLDRLFPNSSLGSYRLPNFDYEHEGPAPQPMGTFLLFRRDALTAAGDPRRPYDPDFPIFFNEVDLLYRLRLAGWLCLYTPRTSVLHYGGESTKQVRKSMIWESHRSLLRYMQKHHGTGVRALVLPFLAAILYLTAFIRAKGYHAGFRS